MKFFCSKDCPDMCGATATENNGKFSFQGVREPWQRTGFVCSKLKMFAEREINNGVRSYAVKDGTRVYFSSDDEALSTFADILEQYKNKKILYLKGSGSLAYNMAAWDRLMCAFDGCYKISGGVCDNTGDTAHEADFGTGLNPPAENIQTADSVILFGKNAAAVSQHLYSMLKELKKQDKRIIYIDPIRTATADIADRYIRINPACDGLLAQALMVSLGIESEYDADSLRQKCGISINDYQYILESIQPGKTAFIEGFGMQRHENGMNIVRLINRLAVKTNNENRLYYGHGSKRYWTSSGASFKNSVSIHEAAAKLAAGEFDLFVNVAANPAMTYPDAQNWAKGIKITKTVIVDTCETRTSKDCDLFIRVGGMFAQKDFMASYFFEHKYDRPALTSELSDHDAVKRIGKMLNIDTDLSGVSEKPLAPRKYTGEHVEPVFPETSDKFTLLSGSHRLYLNSQILDSMIESLQTVMINPKSAEKLGIKQGDIVKISTSAGYYKAEADITDSVGEKTLMSFKNIPMKEGIINNAIPPRLTDSGTGMVYYTVFADVTRG